LLLASAVAVSGFVLDFNRFFGRFPVWHNPVIPSYLTSYRHTEFGAEILLIPVLIALFLLLPSVAAFPVDVGRVTLLPRKIWCLVLSLPIAVAYALDNVYFPSSDFDEHLAYYILEFAVLACGVLVPAAVLSFFLSGLKQSIAFIIAAVFWSIGHTAIQLLSWPAVPCADPRVSANLNGIIESDIFTFGLPLIASGLLVWYRSRWVTFTAGCFLATASYLFHPQLYSLTYSALGSSWAYFIVRTFNLLAAGATWIPWIRYEYIVDVIK